jgi:DNA-binding GntR family transcriptional regulator
MQMVNYQKLYNILREKILKKEYLPGIRIPTERELCDEYGVSRITVRHALMLLQEQNFIERMQGRGTYVKAIKPKKVAIMDFAYSQSMKQEMAGMVRKLISKETVIPPVDIVTALNLLQNEECLFFERLDILEDKPLAFDQVYIPLELTRSITSNLLTRIDFLSAWEKSEGIKGSFVREAIEATEADDLTTNRLHVSLGTPILMGTETIFDSNERPLAVFISKYRSDKFKLVSSYSLLDSGGRGL